MSLAIGPRVAVLDAADATYAAALPDGEIHVLEGPGRLIWEIAVGTRRAAEAPDRPALIRAVAEAAGCDVRTVATDVEAFLDDLVARGLLEEGVRGEARAPEEAGA